MTRRSLICAVALAAIAFAGNANAEMLDNNELSANPAVQAEQIETMIEVVFEPLEPQVPGIVDKMMDIAQCESTMQHLLPNRRLVRNTKSSAAGVFQVLLVLHRPDYQKLGLDPRNVSDNIEFSAYLVERKIRQGRRNVFEDWVCA